MKAALGFFLLFGFCLTGLKAQVAVPASGGNASGSGGTVSYSVGQVVYTTNTNTNGDTVAQGIQQPYEIFVVKPGIEEAKGITLQCSAYPNPADDYLKLKVVASATLSIQSLSYQLYDINSKLLVNKKINGNETSIVMSNLVHATYFLKVSDNKKEIKSFKIVKN